MLYHTLHDIHLDEVVQHFRGLPATSILLAFCITATSYFVVTGYDVVALRHLNRPQPYRRAGLAAFLASAFGNNIGFAVVTGGSIRYRIYSPAGLSMLEIAGIAAMCSLTTTLGMGFVFSISMLFGGSGIALPEDWSFKLPPQLWPVTGAIVLGLILLYVLVTAIKPLTIKTSSWSLRLPSATTTLAQLGLATTNLMLIGTLIYVLVPNHDTMPYLSFMGIFILALMAGSVSNVPGGIGVFETVLLVGVPQLSPDTSRAALLGAILLFRCIHFLSPLVVAAVLMAWHEMAMQRKHIEYAKDTATDWLAEIGPQVMSLIVIFAGVVLLFSGAIPISLDTRELFTQRVPLWLVDLSHVVGSTIGLALIILARGLSRRLRGAHSLTLAFLGVGVVALLFKGLAYREAALLAFIFALLFFTRREFPRQSSLFDQGYPVEWMSTLMAILAVTTWLGLFAYKQYDYSSALWWHFAYDADYSRFLRASFMVFACTGVATAVNLMRPDPIPDRPHRIPLEQVRRIVRSSSSTRANLALLGDKRLLFSDAGDAFIMYRVRGKSWVTLGDPVGPEREHEQLIWMFRELCDRFGGWPVFYLIDAQNISRYVDLGMSVFKLGDDARVLLTGFDLETGVSLELRENYREVIQQPLSFKIVNSVDVPPLIPEFKRVSDAWLSNSKMTEKGFSVGYFNPAYVANFPCAVVYKEGQIVAFAVLLVSADKSELALDLMRYDTDAPPHVHDYLLIEIMLGGRARGYHWFNLGMAPLASLRTHPLAPIWQRIGGLLYRQSEHFRRLEDLRRYEQNLKPHWQPKYLASPGGLNTPRILRDIGILIGRPGV